MPSTLCTAPISLMLLFPLAPASGQDKPRQQEKSFEKEVTLSLDYLLYVPEGYEESDERYPLMLFLHGAGESGDDLGKVKLVGPPKLIETGKNFPFLVASPQSPGRRWNPRILSALLDEIISTHRVDEGRVYLTGLSMGGFGTWALAAYEPDRFAAIAPICGGGDPRIASRIKDLPIWVFHGAADNVVPLARSERMVDALEALGADVTFTVYPDAGHDCWTETYDNPELYDWFLGHTRGDRG